MCSAARVQSAIRVYVPLESMLPRWSRIHGFAFQLMVPQKLLISKEWIKYRTLHQVSIIAKSVGLGNKFVYNEWF